MDELHWGYICYGRSFPLNGAMHKISAPGNVLCCVADIKLFFISASHGLTVVHMMTNLASSDFVGPADPANIDRSHYLQRNKDR